ncbi:MAG: sel1 repeat family protein, partial [Gallionellaceae bacterium]|nr:sel1 repeat family protein [Gallionellaceae bacterium]
MDIVERLERFNHLMEECFPSGHDLYQLKLDAKATEEQLMQLQAYSNLIIPESLKYFYQQSGGIVPFHGDINIDANLDFPGIKKLLDSLNEERGYIRRKSLGLIDGIKHFFGNDRPELEEGEFFNAEELRFLNEHYTCFGHYRPDFERAWYLFFDQHGHFDDIYYDQDCFDELEEQLRAMLIKSPASRDLDTLLEHALKQVESFHVGDWSRIHTAAEQGDAEAQRTLGFNYYNGEDVEKDREKAAFWYRKAAEQGHANAQYNLGCLYDSGEGVEQDYEQAAFWYRKAAEQGHANAQHNLGCLYDSGEGVKQDHEQAVFWYTKAAEQGYADSQNNLGYSYEYGEGVGEDKEKAAFWYRKAAEQGHVNAQYNLGCLYDSGEGV